jgi:hypothetical protein
MVMFPYVIIVEDVDAPCLAQLAATEFDCPNLSMGLDHRFGHRARYDREA